MEPEPQVTPVSDELRGGWLAARLVASVMLTPVGLVALVLSTEITGSPGGTDEARMVAWWLEPFRRLGRRRNG